MENIIIKDSNENELNYTVLLTFEMKNKNYIIYTDSNIQSDEDIKTYYAYYNKKDSSKLESVENEEEIKILDDIVADFEQEFKKGL